MTERERLQNALLRRAVAGQLDQRDVVRVLASFGPAETKPEDAALLLDWLEGLATPEADRLANALCAERCKQLRQCQRLRAAGQEIPPELAEAVAGLPQMEGAGGEFALDFARALTEALDAQRDHLALLARGIELTGAASPEARAQTKREQILAARPDFWRRLLPIQRLGTQVVADDTRWQGNKEERQTLDSLLSPALRQPMPARETADSWRQGLTSCPDRETARRQIDALCRQPVENVARVLPSSLTEPWQRRRALVLFSWRTGRANVADWEGLCSWLRQQEEQAERTIRELDALRQERPAELLLLWYDSQEDTDDEARRILRAQCANAIDHAPAAVLLERYRQALSPEERGKLGEGTAGKSPSAASPAPEPPAEETTEPAEPVAPPRPSVWQQYMRPFLTENWLLVAGILGVLAGVSVLVYRYWESTWLVRYGVVQGLLLGGVLVPTRVAAWLEQRDERMRDTALVLRGAALLLVPVNILCPLMLADSSQPLGRILAPLLGAALLVGLGWWMRLSLARLPIRLGPRFAWALSAMHGFAFLSLLAMSQIGGKSVAPVLGALPFLMLVPCAWCTWTFPHREGDEEPAKQLPPFFATLLAGTFLQLAAWGHLLAKARPAGEVWSLTAVLVGALILLGEYRLAVAQGKPEEHGAPAFAGFAVVLLGLLLSLPYAYIRPVAFVIAGTAWIAYGAVKKHPAHAWIGASLSALGILAIAFIPAYPAVWRPAIAIPVALLLEPSLWRRLSRAYDPLLKAMTDVQSTFTGAAIVATVLSQIHYRNESWISLVTACAAAALFTWFAYRDKSERWTFLAAVGAAIALPYAGFADTTGQESANTMAFGLGVLSWVWIALTSWGKRPGYLRKPRSRVLFAYGCLAMLAMLVRLLLQRMAPDAGIAMQWMDTLGPVLVIAALVLTTYWSRSLVPAAMAAVTGAIFAPEMRTLLEQTFPRIDWGSGMGSACWALVLVAACFRLRHEPRLADLGDGDEWWGERPFPWVRLDQALFTLPIFLTTVFLCLRVDSYVWIRQMLLGSVRWSTHLAITLSGIVWLACAAYLYPRRMRCLRVCAHLGMFWLGMGTFLLCTRCDPISFQFAMLSFCVVVQITHAIGLWVAKPRVEWAMEVLVKPARQVLLIATVFFLALTTTVACWADSFSHIGWITAFCMAQLVWHGLRTRRQAFGWVLLPYALLMAASAEFWPAGPLCDIDGLHQVVLGPLIVLIVVLAVAAATERYLPIAFDRGRALLEPWLLGSGVLAMVCGALMLGGTFAPDGMTMVHFWYGAVFVLLASRANGWSAPALLAVAAGGVLLGSPGVPRDHALDVLAAVQEPWKLGLFACILLAFTHGGGWGYRRWPGLFVSPQAPKPLPSAQPFVGLGIVLAAMSVVEHVAAPVYRDAVAQSGAPYLSAMAFGAAALALRARLIPLLVASGISAGIGTILAVRVFLGPWLYPFGANDVHLIVLGLALDVVVAEGIALAVRKRWGPDVFRWVCATPALLIPILLTLGYLQHPNLADTNSSRCLISGLCALVAAFPFRRLREREEDATAALGLPLCLALGVAALTMAIPWCRQPDWALTALLLSPAAVLILHEVKTSKTRALLPHVVFWLVVALELLHVSPPLYRALCFPGSRTWLAHFHTHAIVPLLGGILLARLSKRHGHRPAAHVSGALLATGVYAVVAQWPLVWMFTRFRLVATIWLLSWGHIWLALSSVKGLRKLLVGEEAADRVVAVWRGFACIVAHVVVFVLIGRGTLQTYASAPMLAATASLLIHAAAYGAPQWIGGLAALELLLSLHLDFLTPSYLPRHMIIWVLLGVWAASLLADALLRERIRRQTAAASQALVVLLLAHVCYCGPGTVAGLVGMALGGVLYALAPLAQPAGTVAELSPEALLFLVPAWLLFWGFRGASAEVEQLRLIRAFLAAAFGFLLVAPLTAWQNPDRILECWRERRPVAARRMDTALLWLHQRAEVADMALLVVASLIALVCAVYRGLGTTNVAMASCLCAILSWGWGGTARRRRDTGCVVVALAAFLLIPYTIRAHLLGTGHWQPEWDIWAALALSSILCVFERVFIRQEAYARVPLMALFWVLPALNAAWVLNHHLWNTDLPLFVSAIHAIQFGYLGRNDRSSPFRAGAVVGAVAFCLIAFGLRLHLRHAYAYVVPIGMGVLVLLRLFQDKMEARDRNTVRTVVLLSMIASTAYYVVADSKLSLVHILVLGLLCLFSMSVAAFTRVRAYLYLGFTGFVVDLIVLLYRVLVRLERGAVMTLVGVLVLGGGVALVAGSIYYKMHREELLAKLRRIGGKLGDWE